MSVISSTKYKVQVSTFFGTLICLAPTVRRGDFRHLMMVMQGPKVSKPSIDVCKM